MKIKMYVSFLFYYTLVAKPSKSISDLITKHGISAFIMY